MTKRSQYLEANYRAVFFMAYGDFPHPCYFCGEQVDGYLIPRDNRSAVIHHVDHDKQNNDSANLVPGHRKCHTDYHRASPETQARQRASQRLRLERDGPRGHTAEARAKMSAAKMGHTVSAAQRAKQSAKMRGRKLTEEQRAKQSAALAGKPKSESHRENIRRGLQALAPEQVRQIRARVALGFSQSALAREYPVGQTQIGRIVRGLVYSGQEYHPTAADVATARQALPLKPEQAKRGRKARLTPEQQAEVYAKYTSGEANQVALAAEYGVSQPYVSTIVRRIAAQEVPT